MSENEKVKSDISNVRGCEKSCDECKTLCACAVCNHPNCNECVCAVCSDVCDECECSICEEETCVGCSSARHLTIFECGEQNIEQEEVTEIEETEELIEQEEQEFEQVEEVPLDEVEQEEVAEIEETEELVEQLQMEEVAQNTQYQEVLLTEETEVQQREISVDEEINANIEQLSIEIEPIVEECVNEISETVLDAEQEVLQEQTEETIEETIVEDATEEITETLTEQFDIQPEDIQTEQELGVESIQLSHAEEDAEEQEEVLDEQEEILQEDDEEPAPEIDPEEVSKEERKRIVEQLKVELATPPRRRYIAAPSEKPFVDDEFTVEVPAKSEMKENVQAVFKALIKEGVKLGYLDKYDGLSASEIKEEYEGETIYEVAEQELRKVALKICQVKKETKIGVYAFSWDGTDVHHIGYLNEIEKSEMLIPYIEDKDNYIFNICGIITGGKSKSVELDAKSGKIKIKNNEGEPYGIELDIAIYKKLS